MPANSIDTIITDPPYGLSFMGKSWDYDVPTVETWKECLRVLKPGGTALIFAGSRTQHRMAVNIEDAGFILKDCIMFLYGSGFPKATDISKQLDKMNGRDEDLRKELAKYLRESINKKGITLKDLRLKLNHKMKGGGLIPHWITEKSQPTVPTKEDWLIMKDYLNLDDVWDWFIDRTEAEREVIGKHKAPAKEIYQSGELSKDLNITLPASAQAKLWNGWKSHGLKPAYEPILVCVKPNDGTYANNAIKWGVSGLNIDGGRIGMIDREEYEKKQKSFSNSKSTKGYGEFEASNPATRINPQGRFPANIILDEEAGKMLDEQSGERIFGNKNGGYSYKGKKYKVDGFIKDNAPQALSNYGDKGGASRFFYTAKASKSERGKSNVHPTVKPLSLMEYLCTLTKTPTGGIVLDPFGGSGTTGMACKKTGRDYILIEKEEEYCEIAEKRIKELPIPLF